MGYAPRDLDEYSRAELHAELARRDEALANLLCDYCNRPGTATACKFPERHSLAIQVAQRMHRINVGTLHPDFNVQGTQTRRSPCAFVPEPECDETDGGR